jgi:hypothetical protein
MLLMHEEHVMLEEPIFSTPRFLAFQAEMVQHWAGVKARSGGGFEQCRKNTERQTSQTGL